MPNDTAATAAKEDITDDLGYDGSLVVEDTPFAIVPEWVITADLSDAAFRVYSLLLRFGGTSGCRMPSRALLARRLHRSVDSIDRALRELVSADVVRVEHRHDGRQYRSNRYHLRTSPPGDDATTHEVRGSRASAATAEPPAGGSRTFAAASEPAAADGRSPAGTPGRGTAGTPGRRSAARVAADVRHYPEVPTQREPPPPGATVPANTAASFAELADRERVLLAQCGIDDLDALASRCQGLRRALGQPTGRWTAPCLALAVRLAVTNRGWPPADVVPALLAVASDPLTLSPVRVAEAGPWWDTPPAQPRGEDADAELAELEHRLAETHGRRPALQAQARAELQTEGVPVTRATVLRRATQILEHTSQSA
jgi:hypothetical protein